MNVWINGDVKEVGEGLTLDGLLNKLEIRKEKVAVELNLNIVPKGRFGDTVVKDGDRVEIVSFVGGG